jgi:hypothetical protein
MGAKVDTMSGGSAEVSINTGAAVMAAKVVDVVVDKASGLRAQQRQCCHDLGQTRSAGKGSNNDHFYGMVGPRSDLRYR